MKYAALFFSALFTVSASLPAAAQNRMTPEMLWSLARVSAEGKTPDGAGVVVAVKHTDYKTEKSDTRRYRLDIATGKKELLSNTGKKVLGSDEQGWYVVEEDALLVSKDLGKSWTKIASGLKDAENVRLSPDGKYVAFTKEVAVEKIDGPDRWADLPASDVQVYDDLNYRHWDRWDNGRYSHLFLLDTKTGKSTDLLAGKPYDVPTKPHGGAEDFIWHPKSEGVLFVTKMASGKAYAQSTNTDLYFYRLSTGATENWTFNNKGYDLAPAFSPDGKKIAWLSMERDGFEADKQRLMVADVPQNSTTPAATDLSAQLDETVGSFSWSNDGSRIWAVIPTRGTEQLYEMNAAAPAAPRKITQGNFDIAGIAAQVGDKLVVSRTDFNHAAELYSVDPKTGAMKPLTAENESIYSKLPPSKSELRMVKTTDGLDMGVWVIYPPGFDPAKKYPALLYCQGGPQGALTQFYSYRWNLQLMAAQGYIVVAPNRRGMPGWGVKWNADISKDWGGQAIRDYLSAIDAVSAESYVDKDRRGCVGASYGGYSTFMLAGMHEGRFKTFIAHDGLFDLKSWYGTTEELWFANWDIGGPYWKPENAAGYEKFSPSNFVQNWNRPILVIQGGMDFRVPVEQGLQAFQAAQLLGLKSRLLYFPKENHWVLKPQNAIAWQRSFFDWLRETL